MEIDGGHKMQDNQVRMRDAEQQAAVYFNSGYN
jgi:hypothetical protein